MLCCFLFIYIIFAYFELIISSNANYIVSTQSEMHLQRSKIVKMLPIELILRRTHTTGCSSQIISNDSGLFFFQHCKKQLFCTASQAHDVRLIIKMISNMCCVDIFWHSYFGKMVSQMAIITISITETSGSIVNLNIHR